MDYTDVPAQRWLYTLAEAEAVLAFDRRDFGPNETDEPLAYRHQASGRGYRFVYVPQRQAYAMERG